MNRKFTMIGLFFVAITGLVSYAWRPCVKMASDQAAVVRFNTGVSKFDTSVLFWGKVVDQNGSPVDGVAVNACVATLRMMKTEGGYREFENLSTSSASDGTFMFSGVDGFSLKITYFAKTGYVLPSQYQNGIFAGGDIKYRFQYKSIGDLEKVFSPDPSSPVIFHLWKSTNPVPVRIRGKWTYINSPEFTVGEIKPRFVSMRAHPDADLKELQIQPDIRIDCKDIGTQDAPEWEVAISAIESSDGVVKADLNDYFLFEAPESGYVRTIKFRYGLAGNDMNKGEDGFPIRFFVRSKNGRWYSAVDSVFFAPDPYGLIVTRWRQWLNPNGSRNLEHDGAHPLPEPRVTSNDRRFLADFHSAQWVWNFQSTHMFWKKLTEVLALKNDNEP